MNVFDLVAKISLDSSQFEAGLKAAGGSMKAAGTKMSAFGATMTKRVTLPIVAIAGASIKAFNEVKNGLNIVTQKTGASGKALEDMHQSVKNLAADIPASFEDIGTAVGEVNTRFNIAGQELEDLSGQFVKFAKVNGTDVNSSIDTTQKALAAFGLEAEDAAGLLDTMTKVGQETGVSMETLMSGLVQNGTAFQQLGLSIDQSVNLMGQLDKSGANSETVMQGLRRALKNAAKEGKPLDKALTDLQDSILNGKDGMDGLTTAYELFGRSGDQIYGAVKNGTIDFTNLGEAAGDAAGTLDKTFEATLTPAEKFQRTLNSLKTTGYEFGNTALSMLAPAFEKISGKAKELSEKWQSLDDGTKQMILKFAGIAAVVGPAVTVFGSLATSAGALATGLANVGTTMASVATGAAGIGTAFGAILVGVVAVTGAVAAYSKVLNAQLEAQYGFNKEQKEHFKALEETTKAYNEAADARDKAIGEIEGEFAQVESLRDEYNSLVDSNGKVKEGYESRADFIKGELAEALGLEKSEIDELIDKNGKLENKIADVMAMKKAEAILEANKDAYTQALQDQKEAADQLYPALKDLDDKKKQLADAEKDYAEKQAEYNEQQKSHGRASAAYTEELAKARDKWVTMSDAVRDGEEKVANYKKTLTEAKETIDQTEGLTQAVADKDTKAIEQWNLEWSEGIKTRLTTTKEGLDEQAKYYDDMYKDLRKRRKEGDTSITDDMLEQVEKRRKVALDEAGYTEKTWKETQKAASASAKKQQKETTASAKTTKTNVLQSLLGMASGAESSYKKVSKSASTQMGKAEKSVKDSSKNMKDKFPVNVGKTLTGFLVSIFTKKVGKDVKQTKETKPFAKAYETPYLFKSPTIYNDALVGDRAGTNGGEVVYGRNNLMNDVAEAVKGNSGGDITVNLYYNASDDANDMVRDIVRGVRRVKMAGVI